MKTTSQCVTSQCVVWVIGAGYVGSALIKALNGLGIKASGVVGRADTARMVGHGVVHSSEVDPIVALKGVTHVVVSTTPTQEDEVLRLWQKPLMGCNTVRWLGYLSSTSVYGDTGGEDVDEHTALMPRNEFGVNRMHSEQRWRDLMKERGVWVDVLRLAGIYGPGRNALMRVSGGEQGIPNLVPHKLGYVTNRTHRDDIVRLLMAIITSDHKTVRDTTAQSTMCQRTELSVAESIFNVADGVAVSPLSVTSFAASIMGVPQPQPLPNTELSSRQRAMIAASRRVTTVTLGARLPGFGWRYPNYRVGLTTLYRHGAHYYTNPQSRIISIP